MKLFQNITICTLLTLLGCGPLGCGPSAKPVEVGETAPMFRLTDVMSGKPLDSESLKGNDVVLLNFWSTTCVTCMKEIQELNQIAADGKATVVGIALDGSAEQLKEIVAAKKIGYRVLVGNEKIFTQFDGYNIPYSLVLSSDLTVRKKFYGPIAATDFEQVVRSIKEKNSAK